MAGPPRAWNFISGQEPRRPMIELGWKSLGVLELTALPSIDEELWVPLVKETDALLVNGGDSLYLCHWMRESGLADLLPSLETVWVGLSAGSMVMTPRSGEDFVIWTPPDGGDEALGLVEFSIFPHVENPGPADKHYGRCRTVGRRLVGACVCDRRSDRHQSRRRHRRSRLRGALEALYPQSGSNRIGLLVGLRHEDLQSQRRRVGSHGRARGLALQRRLGRRAHRRRADRREHVRGRAGRS